MREQTQKLQGRPAAEVASGQLASGVTQTAAMPFVNKVQKPNKGEQLGKLLGVAMDVGSKGMELYQGQKDEEAVNQFATDRYKFMDELNSLGSDAERQLWMQNKVQELSKPGVNTKYREAFLNSFSKKYDSYSKGAIEEGYKVQENLLLNDFRVGLKAGTSYDEITAKYSKVLPKDRYHSVYASAIYSEALADATEDTIRTPEDLKAFKNNYKNIIANYNANPYAGGSKSVSALDIKTKLLKGIDSITKVYDNKFKEEYQVQKATIERDTSLTPEAYEKFLIESEYQDRSDAVTAVANYRKDYNKKQELETFTNEFTLTNPLNNANYEMLSEDKKKIVKEAVYESITFGLQSGAYSRLVNTVTNNTKASDGVIKQFFNTNTTDREFLNKQLTAYTRLKNTRDGNMVTSGISKNDKVTLEILSVYPETDPMMIKEVLNSDMIKDGQFGDRNKYYKDWNKVTSKLSVTDRETANSLRQYLYNTNGRDAKAAIEFVEENYLPSVSKKIDGNTFLGRVTENEAEGLNTQIATAFEGFEYDTVEVLDDGRVRVSNSDNSLLSATVTKQELKDAYGGILAANQLETRVDALINENNDLVQAVGSDVISDIKEGVLDLYKNNSDIIGTLENDVNQGGDIITSIKDAFKAWSNRVNNTNFTLSTDEGYNEADIQIDNVIDTIIGAVGPTKAGANNELATGILTTDQIKEIQKEAGLKATGILGPDTDIAIQNKVIKAMEDLGQEDTSITKTAETIKANPVLTKYKANLLKFEGNFKNASFIHKPTSGSGLTVGPGLDARYTSEDKMRALGVPERILTQLRKANAWTLKEKAQKPKNLEKMTKDEFDNLVNNVVIDKEQELTKIKGKATKLSSDAVGILFNLKHWGGSFKSKRETKLTRWSDNLDKGLKSTTGTLKSPVQDVLDNPNSTDKDLIDALKAIRKSYTQWGKGVNSWRYSTLTKYIEQLEK